MTLPKSTASNPNIRGRRTVNTYRPTNLSQVRQAVGKLQLTAALTATLTAALTATLTAALTATLTPSMVQSTSVHDLKQDSDFVCRYRQKSGVPLETRTGHLLDNSEKRNCLNQIAGMVSRTGMSAHSYGHA